MKSAVLESSTTRIFFLPPITPPVPNAATRSAPFSLDVTDLRPGGVG